MYSRFTLARKFISYYFSASNGKGHGIHSPFVFDFVKNVLNDRRDFYAFTPIETARQQLWNNHSVIDVEDLGAGSASAKTQQRKVSVIAKNTLKSKKLGQLLFRIVNYYRPNTIVELGTSLGVTTAYLGAANSKAKVYTIEGSESVANIAAKNFETLNLYNTELIRGNFDNTLAPLLQQLGKIDFAFVDGNHRLEPTMRYFRQLLAHSHDGTILVFDDIHWSPEMEQVWEKIKQDDSITCTIDLFFIGLVFLRKDFKEKQHFVIRY